MFKLIVALTCLHLTIAKPQGRALLEGPSTTPATILEYTMADDGVGNFNFAFKTSDGTSENAQGNLKDIVRPKYDEDGKVVGEEVGKGLVQSGSYSYLGDDGQVRNLLRLK